MITLVAVVMMAMTGLAQQASLTVNAVNHPWTVTVTALSDDIVRVDVVPNEWNGVKLPTLACDKALNGRVPKVKISENSQVSTMVTENGLSVGVFNSMGLIKVGRGDNDYLVDVLPMRDSSRVVLVHNAGNRSTALASAATRSTWPATRLSITTPRTMATRWAKSAPS